MIRNILLSIMISVPALIWGAEERPKIWTLQSCLDYALKNNIQIKQSRITELSGLEDTELAKAQLFPTLSASVTQGFVNYPSNKAETNNSYTGNYAVNAEWTLVDWGKRTKAIQQQKLQNEVDRLSTEKNKDDIRIAIVQTYLQVMYAMESVKINEQTVVTSKAERDRAKELYQAGAISLVDFSQLESQYSTDKHQLVVAQTSLANYKLQLKQLLELDILEEIELVAPEIAEENVLTPLPSKQSIYATSLAVMPQIRGGELNVEMAEIEKMKAKASFWPTISLNAGVGTGHLSGTNYTFGSQIWNKFNESFGISINIPIFTARQNKTAYNKAKLAITTSELELLDAKKELLQIVEGIYLDATSAQSEYLAAKERLSYVEQSFKLTEEQFFLGMRNTLEMLTEKTNLLNAQQEVLQAKYMAIMSIQLLNIYQNRPVDLQI